MKVALALASLALFLGAAAPGELTAVPGTPTPSADRPDRISLPHGSIAYVPASARGRPAPLLLLLGGTGATGRAMIQAVRGEADRHGIILLSFTSTGENWDAVDSFFDAYERGSAAGRTRWPVPQFGRDAERIDAALTALFAQVPVDPARIGVLGYSHGASYALSLGAANPRLFRAIIALSPGILVLPEGVAGGGRTVYVSHGASDEVQPFARTQNSFVPRLHALGFRVTFRPFTGGHVLPQNTVAEGISLFLDPETMAQ